MDAVDHARAARSQEQSDPSGLPVLPPLAALLEIVLLVVVPGLLDVFVPGFPSLNETQPHFFWLPVVLLSAQYGSLSGLLAAATAIILAALLGWPEQDIGENHFTYLLRVWLQPVLWIATAVVLGQFRLRQIEQEQALKRSVEGLTSQRQSIAEHAGNLRARCEHLERIIAARHEAEARALLTALGHVATCAGREDEALAYALRLGFGDCRAAIYLGDGNGLKLVARLGEGGGRAVESLGAGEAVVAATIGQGRALSVLNPGEEAELSGRALAAVPILSGDRQAIGVLMLEAAPPGELDADTTTRLAAIAAFVSLRLGEAAPVAGRSHHAPAELAARGRLWRRVKWQAARRRPEAVRSGTRLG